jgi:hypothetical protein
MLKRIQFTLGLQDDTTFNETQFVEDLIFEGICDISSRTRAGARVINMTTTENTRTHDLSVGAIIALFDISDDLGFLDRYTREDIETIQRDGGRGYCYEEPMLWIAPITPEPVTLRVFGVFRPHQMLLPDDTPSNPLYGNLAEEFHSAIVTYCLWKGGEYVEHESSGYGEKWHAQYEGQDGNGGEIARIKRVMSKRVTSQANRHRAMVKHHGIPSDAGSLIGG